MITNENSQSKTVLVTGGFGFIGAALHLATPGWKGYRVRTTGALARGVKRKCAQC